MSFPFAPAFRETLAERCRTFPRREHPGEGLKRSAVAITLVDAGDGSGETAFLLTRRAPKLRTHAGQWALPGGRLDPGEGPVQGALRELEEELGVRAGEETVLGVLDDYPTRSGYAIVPIVTWLEDIRAVRPNPQEVAAVYRIRLDEISRPESIHFLSIAESDRPVIRLTFGDGMVHAPTAAMVHQLAELAAGRVTRVEHLEQPVFAWR
jgi:8-oxo-dGTP pyrophosphatase MutT (NUDIX family)